MPQLSEVVETALQLKTEDRASLAQTLLTSLDDLSVDETEELWAQEAKRRLAGFRAGHAASTSSDEVARKAAGLFR